jgi:hypothetical protein
MLRFTEQARPTFITTFDGDNEPLVGRAWVDPGVSLTVFASGDATYSDYRRFGVETQEELAK